MTPAQKEQLDNQFRKQLMFNVVVTQMQKQGKPSVCDGVTLLRNPDGSRCSLGFLVPNKDYKPEFESLCPNAVMIEELDMPRVGYQFYDDIQDAHDRSALAPDWWPAFTRQMERVATKHVLDPSSLHAPA